MRLADLEPAWLSPDVFIFRSPAGYRDLLTCKRVAMSQKEQYALIYEKNPQYVGKIVVLTVPEFAWKFEGNDFNILTVTPSLDASASGNWHGFITDGEIR